MHSPAPHESIAQTVSRNSNGNTLFRVDFDFRPNGTIYGNYMRLFLSKLVRVGFHWKLFLQPYKLSYSGSLIHRVQKTLKIPEFNLVVYCVIIQKNFLSLLPETLFMRNSWTPVTMMEIMLTLTQISCNQFSTCMVRKSLVLMA